MEGGGGDDFIVPLYEGLSLPFLYKKKDGIIMKQMRLENKR